MSDFAVFAGGCFWCLQHVFDSIEGVLETIVGYTGGNLKNPTYEKVCSGTTGHVEAIKIIYNRKIVTYKNLLIEFFSNIDPTNNLGQFCDLGNQYKPIIFYKDNHQKELARKALESLKSSNLFKKPIKVEILPLKVFYPAENYHQKYYLKHPNLYQYYFVNSGRSNFSKEKGSKIKKLLEMSIN